MPAEGPVPGLTSWAAPGCGVFLRENPTGRTVQVGRFAPDLPEGEPRMRPVSEAFRSFGVSALRRCRQAPGEWVAIDEVGFLETDCPPYCAALRDLMEQKRLLVVVRKQPLPFLQELCHRRDAFCLDLDAPFGRVGCVIMASGLGKRFGGNKLMAEFSGAPLIQRTLDATAGVFARRIAVTRHRDVAELCRRQNVPVLLHSQPCRSDTVRLGLSALLAPDQRWRAPTDGPLTGCLFCPGDQPLLRWQTVAGLTLAAVAEPDAVWRAAWQGRAGAPVLFPAWAFPALQSLPQGQGGGAVIRQFPERVRCLPVQEARELVDVDTPQQLKALCAELKCE